MLKETLNIWKYEKYMKKNKQCDVLENLKYNCPFPFLLKQLVIMHSV